MTLLVILPIASTALAQAKVVPVLARSVLVRRVSGVVRVEPRGSHVFRVLSDARRSIPVGSTVDTTHGKVELVTAATTPGATQYGFFNGAEFVVTQAPSGFATLDLVGGEADAACGRLADTAHASSASSRVLRLLHASAHGRFTTRGHYAAATVLGTQWTTSDTCQGTSIGDQSDGDVATRTNNGALNNSLRPGQQVLYRCAVHGQRPVSRAYCIVILLTASTSITNGKRVRFFEFSSGLGTKSAQTTARLCVHGPKREFCSRYPLVAGTSGFKIALSLCLPAQGPGNYSVTWRLGSVSLGAPLSFRAPVGEPFTPCRTLQGNPLVGSSLGSLGSDVKIVNRYSLPTFAHGLDIRIFLLPTAIAGQQVLEGVVYGDAGGAPGALLGSTQQLTYRSSDSPGWYFLDFPRHPTPTNPSGLLQLNPGNYWIGVISGDTAGVAGVAYDPVSGADNSNQNPFAEGPTNPFGPSIAGDERLSLYVDYFVPPF